MGSEPRVKAAGLLNEPMNEPLSEPLSEPIAAPRCPLCGEANGCAPARSGRFDTPCWCAEVHFAPGVLARVPPELQRRACLCRRCATGGAPIAKTTKEETTR